MVFEAGTAVAVAFHIGQFAATAAEFFHYRALVFVRYVHGQVFIWFAFLTVDVAVHDARFADCQFKAFAAHVFQQNGQVQFAASGYAEHVGIGGIFHAQGDVGQQLFCRRSRIWRLVTNLPSVPASGLVFTIKSMVSVVRPRSTSADLWDCLCR